MLSAGTVLTMTAPDLSVEAALLDTGIHRLACVDEVGRGAHGPVAVGVCAISSEQILSGPPAGVADSKMLSAARRINAVDLVHAWAPVAVGWASAAEVDEHGILSALNLAACRALSELAAAGVHCDAALLDGNLNWLHRLDSGMSIMQGLTQFGPVTTQVKADATCAGVAAASVVAKTQRDAHMRELDVLYPGYGFAKHAGYLTREHTSALRALGASPIHRLSWKTPAA
jgi:ribonuclease HII